VRPLFSGRYASGTDSGLVGAVEVVLDRTAMQASANDTALSLLAIQLGAYALLSVLVAIALRSLVVNPLGLLVEAAERARRGDRSARTEIRTKDELGTLSEAFDAMAAEVERTVDTLEAQVAARTKALAEEVRARTKALQELEVAHTETSLANAELRAAQGELEMALAEKSHANEELRAAQGKLEMALAEKSRANEELGVARDELEIALDDSMQANEALARANADLEKAHVDLVASVEEQLRLAETVRELSTPVMRIHRGILTMPLVGHIDEARARQIEEKLLAGIERYDAHEVILDLSGVPFVDVEVARALVRARRCAELVGARVSLVGLRGDVAMSVVRAGVDLSGMTTLADLESALVRSLRRRGFEIRRIAR
jgi:rsbT co-antagonist protein RsbR